MRKYYMNAMRTINRNYNLGIISKNQAQACIESLNDYCGYFRYY